MIEQVERPQLPRETTPAATANFAPAARIAGPSRPSCVTSRWNQRPSGPGPIDSDRHPAGASRTLAAPRHPPGRPASDLFLIDAIGPFFRGLDQRRINGSKIPFVHLATNGTERATPWQAIAARFGEAQAARSLELLRASDTYRTVLDHLITLRVLAWTHRLFRAARPKALPKLARKTAMGVDALSR